MSLGQGCSHQRCLPSTGYGQPCVYLGGQRTCLVITQVHTWRWDPHSSEQLDLAQSLSGEDSSEDHTVSTLYSCPRRRPRSDMEGAALLRLFVLCIWTSGLFLGVGVRAEEAGARVQQNHPGGTDTGDPQGMRQMSSIKL
ncbi:uncharacterized protein LOC100424485 isoform X2 [Macaca mulatta]